MFKRKQIYRKYSKYYRKYDQFIEIVCININIFICLFLNKVINNNNI